MRLDPLVRSSVGLTGPFRPAEILLQVAKNGTKSFGLTGHLGNVGRKSRRGSFMNRRMFAIAAFGVLLLVGAGQASAGNLVLNGGFDANTPPLRHGSARLDLDACSFWLGLLRGPWSDHSPP